MAKGDLASDWQCRPREGRYQSVTEGWSLGGGDNESAAGKIGNQMEEQGAV